MIHLLPDVVNIKQKERGEKIKWHEPAHTCTNAHLYTHIHTCTMTCAHRGIPTYTLTELGSTWAHTQGHTFELTLTLYTKSKESLWDQGWGPIKTAFKKIHNTTGKIVKIFAVLKWKTARKLVCLCACIYACAMCTCVAWPAVWVCPPAPAG